MSAKGFFPGTAASLVNIDGQTVCSDLGSTSMSSEISYQEQTNESSATGMTTNADVLAFVRASVEAWCPKYSSELPGN